MAAFRPVVERLANGLRFWVGLIFGVVLAKTTPLAITVYVILAIGLFIALLTKSWHESFSKDDHVLIKELKDAREIIQQFREQLKDEKSV
jgi:hypothetical protein